MAEQAGDGRQALDEQIDAIEEAYEFMLAYAAQGRQSDVGATGQASNVRMFLQRAEQALEKFADTLAGQIDRQRAQPAERFTDFVEIVREDARKARIALRLILAQPAISSQIIDNLNASIHVRALLTDVFIIDEALKNPRTS